MSEKIIVPVLGESITEATVSKWLKNEGDEVKTDEPIVELETDKVNLEVPSPSEGILGEINFQAGSTVETTKISPRQTFSCLLFSQHSAVAAEPYLSINRSHVSPTDKSTIEGNINATNIIVTNAIPKPSLFSSI